MFGAFKFVASKQTEGKPIVGCKFYLNLKIVFKVICWGKKDKRYHQLLLPKNIKGYKTSPALLFGLYRGLYSKWPRVDFELIKQYKKSLVATICCIGAIPQTILHREEAAEAMLLNGWCFSEDYYVELNDMILMISIIRVWVRRTSVLIRLANKHNIPIIATNDSHYIEEEDASAHDILLCVSTGESKYTPKVTAKDFGLDFLIMSSISSLKRPWNSCFPMCQTLLKMIAIRQDKEHYLDETSGITQVFRFLGFGSEEESIWSFYILRRPKALWRTFESHILERIWVKTINNAGTQDIF